MENSLLLIITLICGAIGANVATTVMKILYLGFIRNLLIGMIGGLVGSVTLNILGLQAVSGFTDIVGMVNSASAAGIGGGVLMTIVGVLTISLMHKSEKMTLN